MLECKCRDSEVEYTIAKDMASKLILIQAECPICGRKANGWGFSVEEAIEGVEKAWKKK